MDLAQARRLAARRRAATDAGAYIADAEEAFAAAVARAFRAVFAPVLDRFASAVTASIAASSLTAPTAVALLDHLTAGGEEFASVDDLATIRTDWATQVDRALAPVVAELFDVGALTTLLQFDTATAARREAQALDVLDEVLDRRAAEYLDQATNRLVGIGDTAWATARDTLVEGFRAGEAVTDLAARVESALGVAENRAVTIARTEVVSASNAGATEGVRVLGDYGPTHKQWMATLDPRTRETHADADGQTVPVADTFDVGGASLDFPGDPAGPPEEVVNCRCTVIFVDDPDASIDPVGRQTGYPDPLAPDDLAAAAAHHEETPMARRGRTFRTATGSHVVPAPDSDAMARRLQARWRAASDDDVRTSAADGVAFARAEAARRGFAEGDGAAPAPDPATPAPGDAPAPVEAPDVGADLTVEVPEGVNVRPVEVVMAVEGRWTGDDRYLLPQAIRWDGMLPIPLTTDHVDDVASVVGLIGDVARIPGPNPGEFLIVGRGLLDLGTQDRPNEGALQVLDRIESGALRGVSIRVDDETLGGIDPNTLEPGDDEWWMYVVEDARLRALSVTPVAAFAEGVITLDPEGVNVTTLPPAPTGPVALPAAEADAIREQIEEEVEDLIEEVGLPIIIAGGEPGDAWAVVTAAASPATNPPAEWFDDPTFAGLTPLTIEEPDENGWRRVYGHLAPWGSCHTGFAGQCITAPHSSPGYGAFRTGEVLAANGARIAVGRLTLGGGHASTTLRAAPAIAHYDETGSAVADVAAGEDRHGIWLAGAVRRGVTDDQIHEMRSSPPSGDWRRIGTSMELVAALHVNVPGFPVPRARTASGVPVALVAAGMVTDDALDRAALDVDDRAARRIAASIGRGDDARVAALAERVHPGGR